MRLLFELFWAFFRIGLFTFGGGYAMLPMLEREVVNRHSWATKDQLLDFFAIGQCTPGVIAVNTATMVGYGQRKFFGALFATLGVITPSVIIITLIATILKSFSHIEAVSHAFAGIRVAVCALIFSAVVKLFLGNVWPKGKTIPEVIIKFKTLLPVIICLLAFLVVALFNLSPVYPLLAAAILGIAFYTKAGEA